MGRRSAVILAVALFACGACSRSGLLTLPEVRTSVDAASSADAGSNVPADAGDEGPDTGPGPDVVIDDAMADAVEVGEDGDSSCNFGSVVGDVFGSVVYFANGAQLPAGAYRVRYVDGCMKYSASQDWSVNAYGLGDPSGSDHWWFEVNGQPVTSGPIPPGTVGFLPGAGGFDTFDDCVQANQMDPPVAFTFPGGSLGVWLEDDPYGDNVPGPNGRSPTWSLECAQ